MVLPALGAVVGGWRARHHRWSDAEIASYLDARWELPESLLSWVHAPGEPGLAAVAQSIWSEERPLPRPRPWTPRLLSGSAILFAVAGASFLLPVRATRNEAPVAERALAAPSLAALEGLRTLPARDDGELARRLALIAEAERIDAELRRGMSREQAQARLGALRDRLAEEHQSLGGANAGSGLDAAARALEGRGTKTLAEALANRDLVAFDEELERLASVREKTDRASARRALEEAAAAARAAGAAAVGSMLDQSAAALDERAARNDALRALSDAIRAAGGESEEVASTAERLDRTGSGEAAEAAAEAMAKALSELSDEEKARLAKNLATLRKQNPDVSPGAGAANAPLDAEALAKQLRDLARSELEVGEAERDRAFRDAERNLDQAGNEVRGAMPTPGPGGAPKAGGSGSSAGNAGNGSGAAGKGPAGAGGTSEGGGAGNHASPTAPVEAAELRARARTRSSGGSPGAHVTVTGPGAPGQSPLRELPAPGAAARARELSNLDDGELPAEYRDQVRRYFTP